MSELKFKFIPMYLLVLLLNVPKIHSSQVPRAVAPPQNNLDAKGQGPSLTSKSTFPPPPNANATLTSNIYVNANVDKKPFDPLLERFNRIVEKKNPPPPPPPTSKGIDESEKKDELSSPPLLEINQVIEESVSPEKQRQLDKESIGVRVQPQLNRNQGNIELKWKAGRNNKRDSKCGAVPTESKQQSPEFASGSAPASFLSSFEDKKRPPKPPQEQPGEERNSIRKNPLVPIAERKLQSEMYEKSAAYYEQKDWKSSNDFVSENAGILNNDSSTPDFKPQSSIINRERSANLENEIPSTQQDHLHPQSSYPSQTKYHQQLPLSQDNQNVYQPSFRQPNPHNTISSHSYNHPQTRQVHYRKPSARSTQSTILKSVWSRVEQGLDSLANAEDMVAGRANRLTNQVKGRARILLSRKTNVMRTRRVGKQTSVSNNSEGMPSQKPPVIQKSAYSPRDKVITNMQKTKIESYNAIDPDHQNVPSSRALPFGPRPIDNGSGYVNANTSGNQDVHGSVIGAGNGKNAHIRAGGLEDNDRRNIGYHPNQQTPQPKEQSKDCSNGRRNSPFVQLQQNYQQQNNNAILGSSDKDETPLSLSPSIEQYALPGTSWSDRLSSMIPSLPRMPSLFSKMLGRGSGSHRRLSEATLDQWKQEEEQINRKRLLSRRKGTVDKSRVGRRQAESSSTSPLAAILSRSNNGKTTSLLAHEDLKRCDTISRNQAILDIAGSGLVALGIHHFFGSLHRLDIQYNFEGLLMALSPIISALQEGWCFYAFSAAILMAGTNHVLFGMKIHELARSVSNVVEESSQYAQLHVRLVSGQSLDRDTAERMRQASAAQTVDAARSKRLQWFVTFVLATMTLMTVSVVRPILSAILDFIIASISLPELKLRPIPWPEVGKLYKGNFIALAGSVKNLIEKELSTFRENPIVLAFQLSTLVALVGVAFLPMIERYRRIRNPDSIVDEELNLASVSDTTAIVSNLGISSASRLNILSKKGSLESTLKKWHTVLTQQPGLADIYEMKPTWRKPCYMILSVLFLSIPMLIHLKYIRGAIIPKKEIHRGFKFDFTSPYDVSIFLLFALRLSWRSISAAVESSFLKVHVRKFMDEINIAVDESSYDQRGAQTKLGSSISPTLGLSVEDFWASHTYRRAWAVKGASFTCNNGEVVAILGENGAGKSRLLTAITESLIKPSKRSLTTTKVRGRILVGGLDASKWDSEQLKKRLCVCLNDVRTIADSAEFMSGFTLDEILEPTDGALNNNGASRAVNVALKITGLSETLLPRLPTKLSTVVTANEEEMKPSRLKPKYHALSPSEWSKLLLTRVIAQTIFENENASNSPLSGSLLLLDDITNYFSELEELKIIQALKKSGAATIFTSNKWASGRLADRVIVVKDGAIVETGNHNELLARGQQSLYGAKWLAMMS